MKNLNMWGLLQELYPLNRSLTGEGLRESLRIIRRHVPLDILEYPSGMECFDWTIPDEWNVVDAYILDPSGNKIIDFQENNLHLLGYSIPFEGMVDLATLKEHLYTLPKQPDAIPYVASFYERRWGFCIKQEQYDELTEGDYKIKIDASLEPGSLSIGEGRIKGRSDKEILLHSYLGHPSMANDQLSGPMSLLLVYRWLLENQTDLRYSYRILFTPETIGTICYLSTHLEELKENVVAGYVLAFTGDAAPLTYKGSKDSDVLANRAMMNACFACEEEVRTRPYHPLGADERQFNAPGINLPVGCLMRSAPGEYPEYHTSKDDLSIISEESIQGAADLIIGAVKNVEANCRLKPVHLYCEPKLDKKGLYPTLGKNAGGKHLGREILSVWGLTDVSEDLIEIGDRLQRSAHSLREACRLAESAGLIETDCEE
jgi:aminopeptidase-like protein